MSRPVTLLATAVLLVSTTVVALADLPGADWMKPDELTQKLEAAGYSN
ncbi:MAG: PepSY domain-containing protein, partial [Methyloceanibacter sp.]